MPVFYDTSSSMFMWLTLRGSNLVDIYVEYLVTEGDRNPSPRRSDLSDGNLLCTLSSHDIKRPVLFMDKIRMEIVTRLGVGIPCHLPCWHLHVSFVHVILVSL